MASIQDLQNEIKSRQEYGIPVDDLQSQIKSLYANTFNNYKYAQGSAQGPATYTQAKNANQSGGIVNIAPATDNQAGIPTGGTINQQGGTTNQQGFTKNDIDTAVQNAIKNETDKTKTMMEDLKNARIKNSIAALQNKYNQTIGDINTKRTALDPTYEAKKTQASTASKLQAKNFAEFLAARGISRGGQAVQYESDRIANLQNTFNQYDAQKKADIDYLTNMENQAKQALTNDENLARSEAETNYLDNFIKYKTQQDTNMINAALKEKEFEYNKTLKEKENLQKMIEASDKKKAEAEANMIKQEENRYGFNLNDTQRGMLKSFNNAMQNPQFVQMYNKAYNSPGGIAKLIEEARAAGREDLVQALKGGRFSKVLNEGMTQYGGEYALPQKWYQNAYDTQTKGADAKIKMIKSNFAYDLESLGLEKLANDVRNGNLDNVKKEIEVSYLPEEKKAELINKYANIEQTQMQTKYIPINSNISQQNADTSRMKYNLDKSQDLNKQQEQAYKDIDNYILNTYTEVNDKKRTVMSVQDKKDIGAYLDGLAVQGVDVNVIKALRVKYIMNN